MTPSSSSESDRPWSDLAPLFLERIRALLDSDLHDVRHRSLPEHTEDVGTANPPMLNCSSIYKISPADDPCDSWLFKSSDANPNTFTLHSVLTLERLSPEPLRDLLDLLQCRISEVCKCCRVDNAKTELIRKVILLPRFVENTDFTVLLLFHSGAMYYFNDGDSVWTAIDVKRRYFVEVILFKGCCYAADEMGSLISIDSAFRLALIARPLDFVLTYNNEVFEEPVYIVIKLGVVESDLCLVAAVLQYLEREPHEVLLNRWWVMHNLGKDIVLVSGGEETVAVSAGDFVGCKENCVCYSYPHPFVGGKPYVNVYHLTEKKVLRPFKVNPHSADML